VFDARALVSDRLSPQPIPGPLVRPLTELLGGFTRPGYEYALTEAELEALPGYSRDIDKSREEARRLL